MSTRDAAVATARRACIAAVRTYNRLSISVLEPVPEQPCLFVANHGFGSVSDLNVWATQDAIGRCTQLPVTSLMHSFAWTVGFGPVAERAGAMPAGPEAAIEAFRRGNHVLVFPGGDREAAKPWSRRNQVEFHGRAGFARLAISQEVPVVPIVTAGAGESLLVLADGRGLPQRLGLRGFLHSDVLPVTISVPWGLSIGLGMYLPYLPAPTKLDTVVLGSMRPEPGEGAEAFAERVRLAMQAQLDRLTTDRVPVLGRRGS